VLSLVNFATLRLLKPVKDLVEKDGEAGEN